MTAKDLAQDLALEAHLTARRDAAEKCYEACRRVYRSKLPEREKLVLLLRYGLAPNARPATLGQVSLLLGITRERARQIENQALRGLMRDNGQP